MSHRGEATLSWTTRYLLHQIDEKMKLLKKMRTSAFDVQPKTTQLQSLSSRWGLDKLVVWKLSREFAVANPFIDCTGSKFRLFSLPHKY